METYTPSIEDMRAGYMITFRVVQREVDYQRASSTNNANNEVV